MMVSLTDSVPIYPVSPINTTATGSPVRSACPPVSLSVFPCAGAGNQTDPTSHLPCCVPVILVPPLPVFSFLHRHQQPRSSMVMMMGQLGRLVDGIKSRLQGGGGGNKRGSTTAAGYDKVEKTESMRVEIRSRQARKLIAKNLHAADSIARSRSRSRTNKRFFLAF